MNGTNPAEIVHSTRIEPRALQDTLWIGAILVFALCLRLVFYTGVFGSDEVTYVFSAMRLLQGDWSASDYIGATRYGMNLPLALFMRVLGTTQTGANLWPLLCSLGEVLLVVRLAWEMWGKRTALIAGLLLAAMPLHVHFAGRMMADAPLAFFITLSFALYWWARRTQRASLHCLAGCAIGVVFWIKEVAIIYAAVFAVLALVERRFDVRWLLVPACAALVIAANFVLFAIIAGDPLHILKVMSTAATKVANLASARTEVSFYPRYLLLDIRHTFLAGLFALAGIVIMARNMLRGSASFADCFTVVWLLGLLVMFTFMVTSLHPFALISKQTNYMLIFAAPLCLAGAWFLARSRPTVGTVAVVVYVAGGIALSAMEQQAVRNFVANSKATISFTNANPDAIVYAPTSAFRVNALGALLDDVESAPETRMRPLEEARCEGPARSATRFVIFDWETAEWQAGAVSYGELKRQLGPCLGHPQPLAPQGFGAGRSVLAGIVGLIGLVPGSIGERLHGYAASYLIPQQAVVYRLGGEL